MRFAAFRARTARNTAGEGGPGAVARSSQRDSDPSKDVPRRQPFRVTAVVALLPLACRRSAASAPSRCQDEARVETGRLRRLQGLAPSSGPWPDRVVSDVTVARSFHGLRSPSRSILMVAGAPSLPPPTEPRP